MTTPSPPPTRRERRRAALTNGPTIRAYLALVVTAVWVVSLAVRVISPDRSGAFTTVDAVVLLVFGAIFGVGAIRKNGLTK